MPEHLQNALENIPYGQSGAFSAIKGIDKVIELARSGRLISAIKHIETANPTITREQAKIIVVSLGYGHQVRWPEEDKQPLRCL